MPIIIIFFLKCVKAAEERGEKYAGEREMRCVNSCGCFPGSTMEVSGIGMQF